ncbi:hypothetical protein AGLY_012387 [Aphis glycines]|uniref:Uncharacterized protein n=1 Tax=Aphis glycines TaxID=307491 RepID=A0A6G0TAV0_APHGL|nr:hypothetical protein AGLY_012387 [Aphis glycines]
MTAHRKRLFKSGENLPEALIYDQFPKSIGIFKLWSHSVRKVLRQTNGKARYFRVETFAYPIAHLRWYFNTWMFPKHIKSMTIFLERYVYIVLLDITYYTLPNNTVLSILCSMYCTLYSIASRNNASNLNFGSDFQWKSEYPCYIIEVKKLPEVYTSLTLCEFNVEITLIKNIQLLFTDFQINVTVDEFETAKIKNILKIEFKSLRFSYDDLFHSFFEFLFFFGTREISDILLCYPPVAFDVLDISFNILNGTVNISIVFRYLQDYKRVSLDRIFPLTSFIFPRHSKKKKLIKRELLQKIQLSVLCALMYSFINYTSFKLFNFHIRITYFCLSPKRNQRVNAFMSCHDMSRTELMYVKLQEKWDFKRTSLCK